MITHTMIVSFADPLPDAELDRYLADIERVLRASGVVESFAAAQHIPVAGEEDIPALIATAIVQIAVADEEALAKAFAAPGIEEVIHTWQAKHPYKVGWANHAPLATAGA
jgi:hypothetical protein